MGGGAGGEEGGGAEPLHPLPLLVQHREPVLHVAVLVGTPTVVKEPRSGKKSSVLISRRFQQGEEASRRLFSCG